MKHVDIYLIPLGDAPSTAEHLTSEEQRYLNTLKNPMRKRQFIAGRTLLKNRLSLYLKTPQKDWKILKTPLGKPYLDNTPIHFNISHSEQYLAIGFYKSPLGLDIQEPRPTWSDRVAKRTFNSDEYQTLIQLPTEQKTAYFYTLWTQKEAQQKYAGDSILNQKTTSKWMSTQPLELPHSLFGALCTTTPTPYTIHLLTKDEWQEKTT